MYMYKILISSLFVLVLAGCNCKKEKTENIPVKVEVQDVRRGIYGNSPTYVGTVDASVETVISFETAGRIMRLPFKEGDRVAKGQLLGTISPTTLKDSHYATQVTLQQAQDAYRRMKKLYDEGVISAIKWVDVETKLRQAEAAERIAREQLSHTNIYAPFSGVITSRSGEVGMNVLPDQPVCKLADVSRSDVVFSVPESDISSIHTGEKAVVTVGAVRNATFEGVVKEKGINADEVSHTYNVRLSLLSADARLLPGMVCSVRLKTKDTADNIVIPMEAVELDTDNTRFVWVVRGGKAYRRNVVIGNFMSGGVEIRSGLSSGDRVIVGGMQKVCDGMSVSESK